jgi:hypothetical protein
MNSTTSALNLFPAYVVASRVEEVRDWLNAPERSGLTIATPIEVFEAALRERGENDTSVRLMVGAFECFKYERETGHVF